MDSLISLAVIAAAIGSGLIAGTFFVFSVAIMRALGRLPAAEGAKAMQSINAVILNPAFLGVFLGTAVLSAAIIVLGILRAGQPGWTSLTAASAIFLGGSIFVTMFFNVPLNNSLAASKPETTEGQALWQTYLRTWTLWNHVRTVASLGSLAMFILGYASISK